MPAGVGNSQSLNFSPVKVLVIVGINNTITWTNQDTATHNVDFTSVPAGSNVTVGTTSPNMKNGQTWTVKLTTPGTYNYVCDFHNWMSASITVVAGP